jgi:hypothetical protein
MRPNRRFAKIRDFYRPSNVMLETNPIRARITDLRERVESLRGYL